jgi:hypothetical protein
VNLVRRLFSAFVIASLLGAAPVARAEAEEPWRAARAHYEHGVALANAGDYKDALDEFNAAYAASPHFAVLYNIAQAELALGRPLAAIDALEKYLRDGKGDVPAARQAQVEAQLSLLKSAFAELRIMTAPPGATLSVDGAEVGRSPLSSPLRLAPGSHVITATRPNTTPVTRVVKLAEGEARTLELPLPQGELGVLSLQCWELGVQPSLDGAPVDLTKAALGMPVSAGRHRVGFSAPGRTWREQFVEVPPGVRAAVFCGTVENETPKSSVTAGAERPFPVGYVLVGAGVVAGGVALGHYVWNHERYHAWQAEQARLESDDVSDRYERQVANNELADSIKGASTVTIGLTVTAGVLVAGGVTWLLLDPLHQSEPAKKAASGPRLPLAVDIDRGRMALAWSGTW